MKKSLNEPLEEKSNVAIISYALSILLGLFSLLIFASSINEFSNKDWKTRDAFTSAGFLLVFCSSTLLSLGKIVDNSDKQTNLLKEYLETKK